MARSKLLDYAIEDYSAGKDPEGVDHRGRDL